MRRIFQPNPELTTLERERSLGKRIVRFLWCLLLLLAGELALVIVRFVQRRRLAQLSFLYRSAIRQVEPTLLTVLRSPPQST